MSEWVAIKGWVFEDGEVMDIWSPTQGRLCDYRYRKNYNGKAGNDFFDPVHSGVCCIRDATHFMVIPGDPKEA